MKIEKEFSLPIPKISNLVASATLSLALFAAVVAAQDGKTIFGDSKKETLKAMALMVKSIGVDDQGKCFYCHIKEDGKPKFPADTQHKQFARLMKTSFVDSLVAKQKVSLEINDEGHKTNIIAEYKAGPEKPGIYLSATVAAVGAAGKPKTFETVLPLPKNGEQVSCMTCHNQVLHFLTQAN